MIEKKSRKQNKWVKKGTKMLHLTWFSKACLQVLSKGAKLRERCFLSCHECGTKKKFWSLSEESNLRPSDYALQCSTNEPQRLYSELGHHKVHILTLGGNLIAILFVRWFGMWAKVLNGKQKIKGWKMCICYLIFS